MEQQVFSIFIVDRGPHRKLAKNVFLNTIGMFKQEKNLLIDIIFAVNFFSDDLFRAAPYRLM